ncbi:MAG: hypothetical protein WBV26_17810, partial [Candidatus Sulfotelmatobacter sp.]
SRSGIITDVALRWERPGDTTIHTMQIHFVSPLLAMTILALQAPSKVFRVDKPLLTHAFDKGRRTFFFA